jgi:hypothetical protein
LVHLDGPKLLNGNCNNADIIATVSSGIANGCNRFIFTSAAEYEDVERVYAMAKQKNISQDEAAGKLSLEM